MRFVVAALAALGLAGCITPLDPVAMGPDTWMIGVHARGGTESNTRLLHDTLARAGDFCAAKGQTIEVKDTRRSGAQGWTPQNIEVVFRCVAKTS